MLPPPARSFTIATSRTATHTAGTHQEDEKEAESRHLGFFRCGVASFGTKPGFRLTCNAPPFKFPHNQRTEFAFLFAASL